jgi:hypothetical protein
MVAMAEVVVVVCGGCGVCREGYGEGGDEMESSHVMLM